MAYPPELPPSTRTDSTISAVNHASDHNRIARALKAIIEVLGASPAGGYADLAARLAALDTSVPETVTDLIDAGVPPAVVDALAADSTIRDAAVAAVTAATDGLDLVLRTDPGAPVESFVEDDYLAAWQSPSGRLMLGIRTDGTVEAPLLRNGDGATVRVDEAEGYLAVWETDLGAIMLGIRTDGTTMVGAHRIGATVQQYDSHETEYLRLSVTPSGRVLQDALDSSGRVPTWVLNEWQDRMGWGAGGGGGGSSETPDPLHIIIVGGQSNSTQPDTTPAGSGLELDPRLLRYNANTGVIETMPANAMSFGAGVARAYIDRVPFCRVLLVETGQGSSGFRSTGLNPAPAGYRYRAGGGTWNRNFNTDTGQVDPLNFYDRMIARANTAKALAVAAGETSPTFKLIAFSLGEDDTNAQDNGDPQLTEAQFAAYMDDLVAQARVDLGVTSLPFLWGSLVPEHYADNPTKDLAVRKALEDAPRRVTGTGHFYGPENMHKFNNFRIHFTAQAQRVRGRLALDALYRAKLNQTTTEPMPPQGLKVTRSDVDVVVSWEFPPTRVTAFQVQISTDKGATWADLILTGPLWTFTTTTLASASLPVWVRARTTNEVGTSDYSFIVKA